MIALADEAAAAMESGSLEEAEAESSLQYQISNIEQYLGNYRILKFKIEIRK